MSRNIVQIIEIRRFEKSDQKNKKTKIDFQTSELRSRSKNRFFLPIYNCATHIIRELLLLKGSYISVVLKANETLKCLNAMHQSLSEEFHNILAKNCQMLNNKTENVQSITTRKV